MRKVIGFELKKLVSRIGIYILVVLMAGLLVAGVFMYEPDKRNTTTLSLVGETVTDMYNSFNNDLKQSYLDEVETISSNADTYVTTSANYMKYNNADEINKLFTTFDDYCLLYNEASATPSDYSILLVGINQSLANLKSALDQALTPTKDMTGYYVLTTNDNYTQLYTLINKISINFTSPISHAFAGENYLNEYRAPLHSCLQKLIYPKLESTAQKYAPNGAYYVVTTSRIDEIISKIDAEYNKVVLDSSLDTNAGIKNELNTLFNRFVNNVEIFTASYNSELCAEALNSVSNKTTRSKLLGYSNVSLYDQQELAIEYKYYIENNTSSSNFANSLSVTHTSNGKINAYDFTYFVMSLFAIVVILFAIYLASHTISGEINNNTMRFTALRPIKRSSIFFGKYFAIIIISALLLLFGTITSLAVGGILYGFESANILMIINGTHVITAHPIAIIGVFILSMLLMVALYSAFTIMLSAIFKTDLLPMIISVVLYAVNLILPIFFGAGSWLRFYPLVNVNLFAYFGSSRLTNDSVLAKIFNTVVYHGMNIWISLIYIFGISIILLLIGRHIFKKREL